MGAQGTERDGRRLSAAGRRMVAAALPENREAAAERGWVSVESLMGSEDIEPGLERGDGFFISHEVAVTAPWAESLVRTGARPRVQNRIILRGSPADELEAARASLKGRKGKSRVLLKRRIERLEAAVRMAEGVREPARRARAPRRPLPPSDYRPARPTQREYLGWTGVQELERAERGPCPHGPGCALGGGVTPTAR